jgi:hypothetical protein
MLMGFVKAVKGFVGHFSKGLAKGGGGTPRLAIYFVGCIMMKLLVSLCSRGLSFLMALLCAVIVWLYYLSLSVLPPTEKSRGLLV